MDTATPEGQAKIWNDGRYKDAAGTAYAWTHNFIVTGEPESGSIPYHLMNESGLWTAAPGIQRLTNVSLSGNFGTGVMEYPNPSVRYIDDLAGRGMKLADLTGRAFNPSTMDAGFFGAIHS